MNQSKNYIELLALRYGAVTGLALIGFFLMMKLLGWVHMVELRALNFIILTGGVAFALRKYRDHHHVAPAYLKGIGLGMLTSTSAVLAFAIFLLTYLLFLDPEFMQTIKENEPFGVYLNPFIASFTIIFEGIGSGYIITFIVMQFMKKSHISQA